MMISWTQGRISCKFVSSREFSDPMRFTPAEHSALEVSVRDFFSSSQNPGAQRNAASSQETEERVRFSSDHFCPHCPPPHLLPLFICAKIQRISVFPLKQTVPVFLHN
uniref:Uncharacterized protein n=1 Tax=Sphaerodactylus townsendi TaxID=933632 RepID=A0ACB8GAT0_9SAUR